MVHQSFIEWCLETIVEFLDAEYGLVVQGRGVEVMIESHTDHGISSDFFAVSLVGEDLPGHRYVLIGMAFPSAL